jgi:small-conductance mechanosensitive channel
VCPVRFKIGEIHVSFQVALTVVFMLVLLLVITRIVQRWLETELLPHTRIEPSLQALHRHDLRLSWHDF